MSDLRGNSIAGAVLASVLGVMGIGIFANSLVHTNYPEKAGYLPEVTETTTGGPAAPSGPPDFGRIFADQAQLTALITRGERGTQVCASCHDFSAGGPNRIGPNLHDVFGRHSASHPGFDYSEGMRGHNVTWDYLTLNDFLHAPGTVVRGTKMAFAGIRNDQDRIAVIAYLRSISPNNVPLPAPLPEVAPADTTTAAGGAPATTSTTSATPAPTH